MPQQTELITNLLLEEAQIGSNSTVDSQSACLENRNKRCGSQSMLWAQYYPNIKIKQRVFLKGVREQKDNMPCMQKPAIKYGQIKLSSDGDMDSDFE